LVVFQTSVDTAVNDILSGAPAATLKQDDLALDTAFKTLKSSEEQLVRDLFHEGNVAAAKAHEQQLDAAEDVFAAIDHLLDRH
ncbi:MAG TPA: hypothetical protein VGY58_00735, partial [Gemmataceae bacterium]|nr:hypothetical protein [Gemmataceae bacterium]